MPCGFLAHATSLVPLSFAQTITKVSHTMVQLYISYVMAIRQGSRIYGATRTLCESSRYDRVMQGLDAINDDQAANYSIAPHIRMCVLEFTYVGWWQQFAQCRWNAPAHAAGPACAGKPHPTPQPCSGIELLELQRHGFELQPLRAFSGMAAQLVKLGVWPAHADPNLLLPDALQHSCSSAQGDTLQGSSTLDKVCLMCTLRKGATCAVDYARIPRGQLRLAAQDNRLKLAIILAALASHLPPLPGEPASMQGQPSHHLMRLAWERQDSTACATMSAKPSVGIYLQGNSGYLKVCVQGLLWVSGRRGGSASSLPPAMSRA